MNTVTLGEYTVPIPLRCMHCEHFLTKAAPTEQFDNYVVVECLKCHCMTPFKLEQSA